MGSVAIGASCLWGLQGLKAHAGMLNDLMIMKLLNLGSFKELSSQEYQVIT